MTESAGFLLLEHTADMGIEAWAPTRIEIYIQAAEGLRSLIFGRIQSTAGSTQEVNLIADNEEELLVAWLNEIVYLCDVRNLVPTLFEIEELDNQRLRGTIHSEVYEDARHGMERQVKAVTYHKLVLTERGSGWYTRVYVDL